MPGKVALFFYLLVAEMFVLFAMAAEPETWLYSFAALFEVKKLADFFRLAWS
jgi:hypothetical protein